MFLLLGMLNPIIWLEQYLFIPDDPTKQIIQKLNTKDTHK